MTYLKQQSNVDWGSLPEEIPSTQAAQILGISPVTLRGYVRDGLMRPPADKRGVGNKAHYHRADVQTFYEDRETRAHQYYGDAPTTQQEEQQALDAIATAEAELATYRKGAEKEIKRLSRAVVRRREELVEIQKRLSPTRAKPRAKWSVSTPND